MKTVVSKFMNDLPVSVFTLQIHIKHILKCIILAFSCQNDKYTSHGFPGRPGIVTHLALLCHFCGVYLI